MFGLIDSIASLGSLLPGEYTASVQTTETLPSTTRYVTLADGVNETTLDLPPTRIDLVFDAATVARQDNVQVVVQGPVSPTNSKVLGFVEKSRGGGATFVGVGYGDYVITAFSTETTSVRPVKVTLTPDRPTATERVTLERRWAVLGFVWCARSAERRSVRSWAECAPV